MDIGIDDVKVGVSGDPKDNDGYSPVGPAAAEYDIDPRVLNRMFETALRDIRNEDIGGHALNENIAEATLMSEQLALDSAGWQKLAGGGNNLDMNPTMRIQQVWRARQYARWDGVAKQTVTLYKNFCIGTGFGWAVSTESERAEALLEEFTTGANKRIFSTQGQRLNSEGLYVDGEMFFAVFPAMPGAAPKLRTIDPLEITKVITNPEDKNEPWAYERKYFVGTRQDTKYYRAIGWDDKFDNDVLGDDGKPLGGVLFEDAAVYHVKLSGRGLRGDTGLLTDMDWSKQYRTFMSSRAAITRAIAAYAHKLSITGSAADVARIKTQTGTGASSTSGESNPPPAPGSMWMENAGAKLTAMKQETAAAAAKVDAGLFLNMATMGSGIFPHYYGQDNSFRLATATAMEPPMMKAFESYQELWHDTYSDLFEYVLTADGLPVADCKVEINAQPIQKIDIGPIVDAIVKTIVAFPVLADSDDLVKLVLQLVGLSNVDAVLAALQDSIDSEPEAPEAPIPPPIPEEPTEPVESVEPLTAFKGKLIKVLNEVAAQ